MPSFAELEGGRALWQQDFHYVAEEDVYIVRPVKGSPTITRTGKPITAAPLLDQRLLRLRHEAQLHHSKERRITPIGALAHSPARRTFGGSRHF